MPGGSKAGQVPSMRGVRAPRAAGGGLDSLIGNLNVSNYYENCRQLCTETRANGRCDVARRLWRQADKVRVVASALAW